MRPDGEANTITYDDLNNTYTETDEEGRTNIPGIFAGGDIATGAATVILAMGAGKRAGRAIDDYLKSKK